jgi:hypothetical protein
MPVVIDDLYATIFKISQGDLDLFKQSTDDLWEVATSTSAEGSTEHVQGEAQIIQTTTSNAVKELSNSSAVPSKPA